MNASALLTSQGWLGPGHALDSRLTEYGAPTYKQKGHRGLAYDPNANSTKQITTGNGLIKPLLTSRRGGSRRGIGQKAHEPASGNQWWLKGFQSALENVGKSESERSGSGASTPTGNAYVSKHSGLYAYFVAGQMMKGTIEEERVKGKKRKSDALEGDDANDEDVLKVKPVKKVQTTKELEGSIPYLEQRDKERRKAHGRAQSTDVEQFEVVGQFFGAGDDCRKASVEGEEQEETKEERRARRRRRKEEKEKDKSNLTLAQMVEEELARLSSMNNSENEGSGAEKAPKKAERKKRRRKENEEQQ